MIQLRNDNMYRGPLPRVSTPAAAFAAKTPGFTSALLFGSQQDTPPETLGASSRVKQALKRLFPSLFKDAKPPETVYAFGTSGYRSDKDDAFNQPVIRQITGAISDHLITRMEEEGLAKPVLIGGDTREKSRRFIPVIAKMLRARGLDVYQADGDVPTPVLAYAAKYFKQLGLSHSQTLQETAGAILMTASHNPWAYGGYNFLTSEAAVVPTHISKQFEALQKAPLNKTLNRAAFAMPRRAKIRTFDPYPIYKAHLKETIGIDFEKIKASGLQIVYDPLYATGRKYFPRLLQEEGIPITVIHNTDERPEGYTGMPEPTGSNLAELSKLVQQAPAQNGMKIGFANDGDSDRFGVLDEQGRYVSPNDVLALTLYHLMKNRRETGVVVRSQATSHVLDELASRANMRVIQTPVGYKYIAEEFIEGNAKDNECSVLIGGESSGGLSIRGHIPEKDGLLANLLIAELVATEKRPLSEILQSIKEGLPTKFNFQELSIKTPSGKAILEHYEKRLKTGGVLGHIPIDRGRSDRSAEALERRYGTTDGVKLYLEDGSWLLIRASGTEPLVRIYTETAGKTAAETKAKQAALFEEIQRTLMVKFNVQETDLHIKR